MNLVTQMQVRTLICQSVQMVTSTSIDFLKVAPNSSILFHTNYTNLCV